MDLGLHHGRQPPPGRPDGLHRRDRGSSTIEVAILLPLIMLLLMLVVQAGIYFHSRAVAVTAARKAVAAASAEDGSAGAGESVAREFLDQNGAALLSRQVTVNRDAATATVTITGDVASVVFGVPFSVTVTVDAPVERVNP